jgi:hypothetical protein
MGQWGNEAMTGMMRAVASAAALSVVVQALVVIVLAAARPRSGIYATIVVVSALTAPAAWLAGSWLFEPALAPDGRLFLVVMHLALGGLFFHFMTLPDRSVTLRILVELLLAPDETLSTSQLRARYGVRTMIESRVEQLCAGGFLAVGPDRGITLLTRGRRFGRFVTAGRRLFGIGSAN